MAKYKITQPKLPRGESLNLLQPNQLAWERFEEEVAAHLERELASENLGLLPHRSKVIEKPKYYSKVRESEIKFDVSIEVYPSDDSTDPSIIWIWECKDYPDRRVGVDELEEFAEKLRQVGVQKGTVATRSGFQSGAIAVAKSYGIGLATLNKNVRFDLVLSEDSGSNIDVMLTSPMVITTNGTVFDDEFTSLSQIIAYELASVLTDEPADAE